MEGGGGGGGYNTGDCARSSDDLYRLQGEKTEPQSLSLSPVLTVYTKGLVDLHSNGQYGWVPVRITVPVFHPKTGILHRYTGVHNVAVICSLSLSLSSYINGHSQEFDFYARFRGFLVALPRAYWQERQTETEGR